jgi:glycosyltransferase involved in cell wall biosynthesis
MPHGSIEPYQELRHQFRKKLFRRLVLDGNSVEAFLVATQTEKLMAESNKWVTLPVLVAGIGVENPFMSQMSRNVVQTEIYALFIGRIAEKKRIDLSINALHILKSSGFSISLKIAGVGDEDLTTLLKEQVKTLGIEDSVKFLGQVAGEDKWDLIRNATLTILPSENENFAVSVAESLLAGTPVVLSSFVALSSLVAEHNAGEVLEELDSKELASKIEKVALNRDLYSKNALAASDKFSYSAVGVKWLNALHFRKTL